MILRRCPACRTLCDAERDPRCFACGSEYRKDAPPSAAPLPQVQRLARRDSRISNVVLLIFAVIGGFGVFNVILIPDVPAFPRFMILGVLIISAVLGITTVIKNPGPGHDSAGRIALKFFAGLGVIILALASLVAGLVMLLFVACATGLMR